MFPEYLTVAFLMVRAKPVRSVLSLLGIYIGVLALVIILAINEGLRRQFEGIFYTQGAQVVLVQPGFDAVAGKVGLLRMENVSQLKAIPGILSVLPRLSDEREARSAKSSLRVKVAGADAPFFSVYRVPVSQGRVFLEREVDTRQAVCLITRKAAEKLFPYSSAWGQMLDIQGKAFQVIGVVAWNPEISQRAFMEDPDLLLPFRWLMANPAGEGKSRTEFMAAMEVRIRADVPPEQAAGIVRQALSRGDANRAKLYNVITFEDFFKGQREFNNRIMRSLLAIAAISLIVGAIGVANVMLTSVTERTREVGIRKALGATRRDILLQFLVESCALCAAGGLLAIATGGIIAGLYSSLIHGEIAIGAPKGPMAVCLALTLGIGLISGLYPASRAAGLSPAEALRYE